MTAPTEQDKSWSGYAKMEGEDGVKKTLDCLRGRLLAERQASRAANENAQVLGNKLIELENKLREETKLRRRAEKKLKFLKMKIESLKITPSLEGSEHSGSSDNCGFSCTSSSSIGPKDHEKSEPKSQTTSQIDPRDMENNAQETTVSDQNHSTPGTAETSATQDTSDSDGVRKEDQLDKYSNEPTPSFQDSETDANSSSILKISRVEPEMNSVNESDNEDNVDNSLALVTVCAPASTNKSELKMVNKSVVEVLEALKHAKEQIQKSMETGHMIRVGPTRLHVG